MLYLGVDIGTSRMKATVLSEEGKVVAKKEVQTELLNPNPGFFEIDPINSWKKGFIKICQNIGEEISLQDIQSLCVSSVCGTFVPVDKQFNPLYNAILYGIDSRAIDQINRLNKKFEKSYLLEILGGEFTTHSLIPKFLWIKENKPEIYEKALFFLESTNFITSWLTGETAWDYPTASGAGLINLPEIRYASEIFIECALDERKFPSLKWPLEVLGEVSSEVSKQTGLKKGTTVLVGACDINAELIGCEVVQPGEIVISYGSTISFILLTDHLLKIKGFRNSLSSFKGLNVLGGATSSGARFLKWVSELLSINYSDYNLHNLSRPTRLLILPYLDGARSPHDNPLARVTFHGMTSNTTKEELLLAALESLGFELAGIIEKIKGKYSFSNELHSVGGLSNDNLLMQVIADVTGIPNRIHLDIDASFGDALIAMTEKVPLQKILEFDHITALNKKKKLFIPSKSLHNQYISLLQKFESLYLCTEKLQITQQ